MHYNPANWFWYVAGDASRVWSSAKAAYIPATDPAYAVWKTATGRKSATSIASEAELQEVLAHAFPAGWPPSAAQQAAALVAGGLTITSTSTSSITGTYDCSSSSVSHVSAEISAILLTGNFSDGSSTLTWTDKSGAAHVFPSVAEFKAFASAVFAFTSAAQKVIAGFPGAALPSNAVTIA